MRPTTYRLTLPSALAFLAIPLALTACGENEPAAPAPAAANTGWKLDTAPEGAQSVTEAKADAAEGEPIVMRGRIGGRAEPISDGSPVFTLVDLSLAYCGQETDDGCPLPWDYCCETPETIAAHSATVLVVDAQSRPLTDLATSGLEPLNEVVVVGEVAARPTADVLTIRATGVYVVNE